MSKALMFNKEHPNGYICEIADDEFIGTVLVEPTAEERLAALESAMLELIKGGVGNA